MTRIDEAVHVDATRDRIASSPDYDPEIVEAPDPEDYYVHYGRSPYWGPPSLAVPQTRV